MDREVLNAAVYIEKKNTASGKIFIYSHLTLLAVILVVAKGNHRGMSGVVELCEWY